MKEQGRQGRDRREQESERPRARVCARVRRLRVDVVMVALIISQMKRMGTVEERHGTGTNTRWPVFCLSRSPKSVDPPACRSWELVSGADNGAGVGATCI